MTTTAIGVRKYAGYRNPALQERILAMIDNALHWGLTAQEIGAFFDPDTEAHQGDISGALSMLHRDNHIARLSEKRLGCKVYVTPDFIDSRQCEAQGYGSKLSKDEIERLTEIRDFLDYWFTVDTDGAKFGTRLVRAEKFRRDFFRLARRMFGDSVNPS